MAVKLTRAGGGVIEVADENVKRYEADGWTRVQQPKKAAAKRSDSK